MAQVDLWRWRLDPEADRLAHYRTLLSDEECARADRFAFPIHRRRFIAAHGRLREILGSCIGADPAALQFSANAHGKPALTGAGEQLHFNLSHSDEMAIVGVSAGGPLGVDIEAVRPVREDLAEHHFAKGEIAALGALPPDHRLEGFYLCWTRKEAYIKAVGRGLAIPLDSFEVSLAPDAPAALLRVAGHPGEPAAWRIASLLPAPGYVGAVAMRDAAWTGGVWKGDAR